MRLIRESRGGVGEVMKERVVVVVIVVVEKEMG